jgi:type I restriction enzyme S subunit
VRPRLLLSDKSLRLVPVRGVRADWLWRALQAPSARRQISARATGTKASMRNISQESLKRVRVPYVTVEEQAAAVASFAEIATVIDRLRTELRAALVRSRSLRRSLLAAAFSGQLSGSSVDRSVVEETVNG